MTLDFSVTFQVAALNVKNSHLYFPIINVGTYFLFFPLQAGFYETKGIHNRQKRGKESLKAK